MEGCRAPQPSVGVLDTFNTFITNLLISIFQASRSSTPVQYTDKTSETGMASVTTETKAQGSNLMDSGLDDIRVPILQPKQTDAIALRAKLAAGTGGLLDGGLDDLMIPVLEPERKPTPDVQPRQNNAIPTGPRSKIATGPWDGKIRWAIKGCSVFENDNDELDAFMYRPNILSREPVADLWVFQYGIRYVPAKREKDVYRTVKIENFPIKTDMGQILSMIPGEIYSARLLKTSHLTGSPTAIVVFVTQNDAMGFLGLSRAGLRIGTAMGKARVTLVNTPTYPMTAEMQRLIKEGYTRTLAIYGPRESLTAEVCRVLKKSVYCDYIERVNDGHVAGEVFIRFHGIKMAAGAYELFKVHPSFRQCKFRFLKASSNNQTGSMG
ncbi:hypothetical protein MW887_010005 [Aspergillus wentii]|nr:hypothetical protein MW887_010005 [Aspergillus wentii]